MAAGNAGPTPQSWRWARVQSRLIISAESVEPLDASTRPAAQRSDWSGRARVRLSIRRYSTLIGRDSLEAPLPGPRDNAGEAPSGLHALGAAHPMTEMPRVAYFSMEIALDSAMPGYSGGLGVLAGDMLRSAADLRLPMVRDHAASPKGLLLPAARRDGPADRGAGGLGAGRLSAGAAAARVGEYRGSNGLAASVALRRHRGRRRPGSGLLAGYGFARERGGGQAVDGPPVWWRPALPAVPGGHPRHRWCAHATSPGTRRRPHLPHERGACESADARAPRRAGAAGGQICHRRCRRRGRQAAVRVHDAHTGTRRPRPVSAGSRQPRPPSPRDRREEGCVLLRGRAEPDVPRAQSELLRERRRETSRRSVAHHVRALRHRCDHQRRPRRHLGVATICDTVRSVYSWLAREQRSPALRAEHSETGRATGAPRGQADTGRGT